MATITDFDTWIAGSLLIDYNEVYCLYRSVHDIDEFDSFKTSKKVQAGKTKYFVTCDYLSDTLMLASDKAREYFLDKLEKQFAGEMGMEGWYAYNRAMEKDD